MSTWEAYPVVSGSTTVPPSLPPFSRSSGRELTEDFLHFKESYGFKAAIINRSTHHSYLLLFDGPSNRVRDSLIRTEMRTKT